MKTLPCLLVLSGLISAPAYAADAAPASPHTVTANVGVYSQYIYRGITQTARKPALQGGMDYSHASGFYLGAWGSNVSWISDNYEKGGFTTTGTAPAASLEVDLYGGYKGAAGAMGYDVGVLQYWYPGSYPGLIAGVVKPDTTEVYGALSYGPVTGKLSYVVSSGLFGVDNADGSWYADVSVSYPIADGWTLVAHVGHQKFKGSNAGVSNSGLYTYSDWKLGVAKDLGNGWSATAYYTDTNAKNAGYQDSTAADGLFNSGKNTGAGQFVVGVSRSF